MPQYNKNQEQSKRYISPIKSCKPTPCRPIPCKPTPCKPTPCKPTPTKPIETVTHDFKIVLGECTVKKNVTYTHCLVANVEHTINENIICNHKPTTQHKVTNKKTYVNGKTCTAKPKQDCPISPKLKPKPPQMDDEASTLYSCATSRKKCKKIDSSSSDTDNKKSRCKKYPVISSDICSLSD
jgi:hypothetical protein